MPAPGGVRAPWLRPCRPWPAKPKRSLFRRQVERTQDWLVNAPSDPTWDDAAFSTQGWLRLTPAELNSFQQELQEVVQRWRERTRPTSADTADSADSVDSAASADERESVFWYARGFPCQP